MNPSAVIDSHIVVQYKRTWNPLLLCYEAWVRNNLGTKRPTFVNLKDKRYSIVSATAIAKGCRKKKRMDRSYGLEIGSTGPTIYKTGISDLQVLYFPMAQLTFYGF